MKKKYVLLLFLFVTSFCLHAQQSLKKLNPPSPFKTFYAVEVRGLKSENAAEILRKQISADQRFIICKIDFKSGIILVAAEKGVEIEDIKFYTSQYDLVIAKYAEKLSEEKPEKVLSKMSLNEQHD